MTPIKPMLASLYDAKKVSDWRGWSAEEKYDGHRVYVEVVHNVSAILLSRPRGDGRMLERPVPPHLAKELVKLPTCAVDGELLAGEFHTDVKRKDLAHTLTLVVFDLLNVEGRSWAGQTYHDRRAALEVMFLRLKLDPKVVRLSTSIRLTSERDKDRFVKAVWATGGEGAILKRNDSLYHAGKRSPEWLKVKRVEHATLTLVGFKPSKGTVRFPGHPFARAVLRDDDGNETSCKVLDDVEFKRITDAWSGKAPGAMVGTRPLPKTEAEAAHHPWVGKRRLVIEFNKRTRDGGYEGPVRWDRWSDE